MHTHRHTKLACSAIVGLRGWHSWQCQSTLGTIFLFPCQSQPMLITFKFTKLYWQDEGGQCCSLSCWETKLNADLSQGSGFPIVPAQVYFNVKSENVCARRNGTFSLALHLSFSAFSLRRFVWRYVEATQDEKNTRCFAILSKQLCADCNT